MRKRREGLPPLAVAASLAAHAAIAAALLIDWGGTAPMPLPTVVVELVDGPPGQRNAVQDQAARNAGVAAQPEPQRQAATPSNAQPTEPAQTTPPDTLPPPDAQRPPEMKPEPTPQVQATLPAVPPPPPEPPKPTAQPTAKPPIKPPTNTRPAMRPNDARPTDVPTPSDNVSTTAPSGELTPPRFGIGAGQNPMPEYPDYARRRGWEGRVVLSVQVDEAGRSRAVSVKQTSGYPMLDEAALTAVRAWRFTPGMRDRAPVAAQIDVPIRFRLEDVR